MVSNLSPRQIPGIGGEAKYIDSHLLDKAGRLRDLNKVAKEIGDSTMQFAYLDYELRQHMRRPMARGYPPRIFISYRRKPDENVRWCRELAGKLKAAGYDVMLDALAIQEADPSPEIIGRFVGQLATADVALVVLTPEYAVTEQGMRRWPFEEWFRITVLREWGLLEVVGVIRDGEWRDSIINKEGKWGDSIISFTARDALIDLSGRSPADQQPVLDFFGRYSGPRITEADGLLLAQHASACINICCEGKERTAAKRQAAAEHLSRIRRFQETEEFRVANVSYHAAFGSPQTAFQLAREARATNLTLPASAEMGTSLWLADQDDYAFQTVAEVAESPSWWQGRFHWYMADMLEHKGFLRSAINHLGWCITVRPGNSWEAANLLPDEELGSVREDVARALRKLMTGPAAFQGSAERRVRDLDRRCDICEARYSSAGASCRLCGALHAEAAPHCEMCGTEVVSLQQLRYCPVCRTRFAGGPGSARVRHLETQHFPAGRFSVLWPQGKAVTGNLCGSSKLQELNCQDYHVCYLPGITVAVSR